MKRTIFLVALIIGVLSVFSAPIDRNRALELAKDFYNQEGLQKASVKSDANVLLAYEAKEAKSSSEPLLYVFNKDSQDGFIIISGDDRTLPVLGYSDSGEFDEANLPDNFKSWLEGIEQELEGLRESKAPLAIASSVLNQQTSSQVPLLGNTAWNQGNPYNLLCPQDGNSLSFTGCGATAIAQIMYYHRWPEQGQGSISYQTRTRGFNLSMDFSQSFYDWNNMTPQYDYSSSPDEENAVAKLMVDVGHAVEMDYTNFGSGAYPRAIPFAMVEYFNYDENISIHYRKYYTNAEWMNMARKEINENRPICITGYNPEAGHGFVCDGYDQNDLFHINWGWGGTSNGYFALHALNPSTQGIGGSSEGYNMYNLMIIGIQPPTTDSEMQYAIYHENSFEAFRNLIGREEAIDIYESQLLNLGTWIFSGDVGIGLYKNDELIQVFAQQSSYIDPNYYSYVNWDDFQIPLSVEAGTYRLYPVFKSAQSEWEIVHALNTSIGYVDVLISSDEIKLNSQLSIYERISIPEGGFTTSALYTNRKTDFDISIENTGEEASMNIQIQINSYHDNNSQFITEWIYIPANTTTDYRFRVRIDLPPGEYYAQLRYAHGNDYYDFPGNYEIDVIVNDRSISEIDLSLLAIQTDKTDYSEQENILLSGTLKNNGGFLYDDIIVFLIDQHSSFYTYQYFPISIDEGEIKNFNFTLTNTLPPGNYYTYLSYWDEHNFQRYLSYHKVYYNVKSSPKLSLSTGINTDKNSYVNNEDIIVDISINNTGGVYDNLIYAHIYNNAGELVASQGKEARIEEDQTEDIQFILQKQWTPGEHYIEITYYDYRLKTFIPFNERKYIVITTGGEIIRPDLLSSGLSINKSLFIAEEVLTLEAVVYNRGTDYSGIIDCHVFDAGGVSGIKTIYTDALNIASGETYKLALLFTIDMPEADYLLQLGYELEDETIWMGIAIPFGVVKEPLLKLTKPLELNTATVYQDEVLTIKAEVTNEGYAYNGQIRAVIRNSDNEITENLAQIQTIAQGQTIALEFEKAQVTYPAGHYTVTIEYLSWEGNAYIPAEGDNTAAFEIIELPNLELASLSADKSLFEKGETATFTASVSNTGTLYNDEISLLAYRGNVLVDQLYKPLSVDRGETISVQFEKTIDYIDNGTYKFYIAYKEEDDWVELGKSVSVDIYAQPILSLSNGININKASFKRGETMEVSATVGNKGAAYNDNITMVVFDADSEPVHSASKIVEVKRNEPANVNFEEVVNLPDGNYTMKIEYKGKDGELYFNDTNTFSVGGVSIDEVGQSFSVYPNPAKDYLNIKSDKAIQSIHITDITGKTIRAEIAESTPYIYKVNLSGFAEGIYLVTVKTNEADKTIKVVKKK